MQNFTRTTPSGNPTDREKAIDELYKSLNGLIPSMYGNIPYAEENNELSELVSDFWQEKRGRSIPTADMIRSVAKMIELTRDIDAEERKCV